MTFETAQQKQNVSRPMNPPAAARPKSADTRLAEIENQIREVTSQIGERSTLLQDRPNAPALTDRQKYEAKIANLKWTLRNNEEPLLKDYQRLVLEAKGRLDEAKARGAKARAKLDEIRLSSLRLASAIDGSPNLLSVAKEMDELAWWIECEADKIRSHKAEVARFEGFATEKEKYIRELKNQISALETELHNFDTKFRAEIAAERETMLGWVESRTKEGWSDGQTSSDAEPEHEDDDDDTLHTKGSASRTTQRPAIISV